MPSGELLVGIGVAVEKRVVWFGGAVYGAQVCRRAFLFISNEEGLGTMATNWGLFFTADRW